MNKIVIIILALFYSFSTYSQQVLMSWGQQTIEGLTKDKYDVAQKLTGEELLQKNLADETWCDVSDAKLILPGLALRSIAPPAAGTLLFLPRN